MAQKLNSTEQNIHTDEMIVLPRNFRGVYFLVFFFYWFAPKHEIVPLAYSYHQEYINGGRVSNCTYTNGEHRWESNMTST